MPVKIRLQRKGRKKAPFYHIVIADSRSPRDGRYIERIGNYNPLTVPATIDLDREKAFDWLMKGAQPTDTARAILKFKGVFYKKHLQRGVAKGALTQEQADQMLQEWIDAKESKVEKRKEANAQSKEERRAKIFGNAPVKAEPKVEEEAPAEEEATVEEGGEEEAPATEEENTDAAE
jgi:small subunit ribosomal protein S16